MAHPAKTKDHVVRRIQEMIDAGASRMEITAETGVYRDTITRMKKDGRLTGLPTRTRSPYTSAAGRGCAVPTYITDPQLRCEFREYAGIYGKPQAEVMIRRLMVEAARV